MVWNVCSFYTLSLDITNKRKHAVFLFLEPGLFHLALWVLWRQFSSWPLKISHSEFPIFCMINYDSSWVVCNSLSVHSLLCSLPPLCPSLYSSSRYWAAHRCWTPAREAGRLWALTSFSAMGLCPPVSCAPHLQRDGFKGVFTFTWHAHQNKLIYWIINLLQCDMWFNSKNNSAVENVSCDMSL